MQTQYTFATHATHNFTYNATHAEEWGYTEAEDSPLTLFVNCNAPTAHYNEENFEALAQLFASNVQHTHVNEDAFPVLVYMQGPRFVAWLDLENMWGYIAA